jgi:EKC/KEOPS complex subunit CGI121/TPRKB
LPFYFWASHSVLLWIRFWQTFPNRILDFLDRHSNTRQIVESFRRFGIAEETTSLIALKIIPANGTEDDQVASVSAVSDHLKASVEGDPLPFTESNLAGLSDVAKICKIYKVEGKKATTNGSNSAAGRIGQLEGTILGIMAIKGS